MNSIFKYSNIKYFLVYMKIFCVKMFYMKIFCAKMFYKKMISVKMFCVKLSFWVPYFHNVNASWCKETFMCTVRFKFVSIFVSALCMRHKLPINTINITIFFHNLHCLKQ
jgi:hypothetical protein